MIRERFRTNHDIFENNTSKQESYPAYVRNLDESTLLQPETELFEDRLEQESPFRVTQYTEAHVSRASRKPIAPKLPKIKIVPFSIVVKSFIQKPIELFWGQTLPSGFSKDKALKLIGAAEKQFSENPTSDKRDKKYRIYSRQNFRVSVVDTDIGTRIVNVEVSGIDTDVGREKGPFELSLNGTSGIWDSSVTTRGWDKIEFSWSVEARIGLDPTAKKILSDIYNRDRPGLIWHGVSGTISPSSASVDLKGSLFPRHKIWVNGVERGISKVQAPLMGLWFRAANSTMYHDFDRLQ
jgi:hypothetical protein